MKVVVFLILAMMLFVFSGSAQGLTPIEELGKQIYFEKISSPDWMSCATCHAPEVGFVGPNPAANTKTAVYNGAVPQRFGNRKPPSASYATLSPIFDYDKDEGLFYGGNFWDGRATGWQLGSPTAEQAIGPFLNPVEHNMPSKKSVLVEIEKAKMGELWEAAWGKPLSYATEEAIDYNYDLVGLAIAEFEASEEVNPYSSKFDYYWDEDNMVLEEAGFTDLEWQGWLIFKNEGENEEIGAGKCILCHMPPEFTDFTFDNLGIPANPDNPFYEMDEVYLDDGTPINPDGDKWIDHGLGGFLAGLAVDPNDNEEWRTYEFVSGYISEMTYDELLDAAEENDGKHRVPSLRNVGKRPSKNYVKAYGHNGYFKSLEEITNFYNTRDVMNWPAAEVPLTVNDEELGDLGLLPDEEAAIVAFMNTLSDGYDPAKDKVKDKDKRASEFATLKITGANPFNPSTTLSFTISQNSTIKIAVYNVIGQRVATLIDGLQPAGTHMLRWNASRMSSGTYFVRMEAQTNIITRKLLLVK